MKPLTVPQSIVLGILILTVGVLTWYGAIPRDAIAVIIAWLIPSPIQQIKPEGST